MKKIVSMLVLVAMLLTALLSLASCGAPEDGGPEIDIYLGYELYDFDPTDYYVNSNAEQVLNLLFEPLFRLNEHGDLECAAAESYEVNTEEREIVIKLRESYWSDNTRVKASDFVYAWLNRLLDANNANPAAALLYDIEGAADAKAGEDLYDVQARATSSYELTIGYREGADYNRLLRNLASVATAPVHQSKISHTTSTYWSKQVHTLDTNGPFKVIRYSLTDSELVLGRNKGYHQDYEEVSYRGQVTPGQLVGFTTATGEEIALSYSDIESKTIFYMLDAPVSDRIDKADSATKVDDTSVYTYVFNTDLALFRIPEVRLALSMAIDREAIAEAVALGKAADGFLPDISGGSSEALISTEADLEAAEALLESDEVAAKLKGVSKSFTITIPDREEDIIAAELVEAAWESLGFSVTVETVGSIKTTIASEEDSSQDIEFYDCGIQALVKDAALGERNFDVIAVDWQTYSADPFVGLASLSYSLSGCGYDFAQSMARPSISGWVDSEYSSLIANAYKAWGEERAQLLLQAEAYLCEAMPVCPILFNQNIGFASSELSGIKYDGLGNIIFTKVDQWNYKEYLKEEE